MDSISFTTFLKISGYSTTQRKISEVQKLHNGDGGYDFYKRLKSAAKDVAQGQKAFSEIENEILSIKRVPEREHNHKMVVGCRDWWDSLSGARVDDTIIKAKFQLPGWKFSIRIAPELVYHHGGERFVTYLWATKTPALTPQIAGMGLYILQQALAGHSVLPARLQIRDLRNARTRADDLITNQSPTLLAADAALLNSIWPN